ncbi:hypothetical protein HMPREF1199_01028 [Hoylesella oralis CC98A]|nr:hypothetical protein HMPREF1199_01028 [Hoylesella oralis CC98A]
MIHLPICMFLGQYRLIIIYNSFIHHLCLYTVSKHNKAMETHFILYMRIMSRIPVWFSELSLFVFMTHGLKKLILFSMQIYKKL